MNTSIDDPETAMLRLRSEEVLKQRSAVDAPRPSTMETIHLVHELEVHRIELEIQNEELVAARSVAQKVGDNYKDLYDFAPSGYVTLSAAGEIQKINFACARLLGRERSRLENKLFRHFVSEDTQAAFNYFFQKVFESKANRSCDVTLSTSDSVPIYVHLTGTVSENSEEFLATMVDITERKQAENALQTSRDQLRILASHLVQVREEERTAIAREIHDELGQTLTALKMSISGLAKKKRDDGELHDQLILLCGYVDETIRTVRHIATELRPGVLDELGLGAAVEWHARTFMQQSGIEVSIDIDTNVDALPQLISTAMFRIFQESLTNVARHSGATVVTTKLAITNQVLYLEVADNGCGIPETRASGPRSIGLLGMKERALSLGGDVVISSVPESGTTVTAHIPLVIE